MEVKRSSNVKTAISVVIPFVLLAVMIGYVFGPGSELIGYGILLPDISIEKIEFVDSEIIATVRNTGPIPVDIVMADINEVILVGGMTRMPKVIEAVSTNFSWH